MIIIPGYLSRMRLQPSARTGVDNISQTEKRTTECLVFLVGLDVCVISFFPLLNAVLDYHIQSAPCVHMYIWTGGARVSQECSPIFKGQRRAAPLVVQNPFVQVNPQ